MVKANEKMSQVRKHVRGGTTPEIKGISHNKEWVRGAIHQKKKSSTNV